MQVFTADLRIDTTQPAGEYVRQIMLATAEFDASSILKNTAAGRDKRLRPSNGAKGKPWLSGPHYGYRYRVPNPLEKIPGAVVKQDGEAEVVIRMFERRAKQVSCERIATELTADDIPTPAGHKVWNASTVYYILNNPAYLGTGKWGRRQNQRSANGKRSSRTRRDGTALADMDYPPIVSQELWDRAHAATHCVVASHARKGEYLLNRGMVRCAEHNRAMTGTLSGNGRPRYQCRQRASERCPDPRTHSVPGDELAAALWAELVAFLADPERGRRGVAEMIAERDRAVAVVESELDGLRKREAALEARASAALDLGLTGRLARTLLEEKLAEIEQELEAVRAEIRRAEARLSLARIEIPSTEQVAEVCRQLSKGAYCADAAGKRELLESLQMKVWVRGEEWWADGIVPGLHLGGTIQRNQWVQDANAPRCVRSATRGPPLYLERQSIVRQLDPLGQLVGDPLV